MKIAVVLFNLGGPDGPGAVRPFLQNLFSDPAIITAPGFVRLPLAWWIARKRAPLAQEIYENLGGASPILANTQAQADALECRLNKRRLNKRRLNTGGSNQFKCFIAMRYWHPRAAQTVRAVKDWAPDRVVLLPLYPQFSTTTSQSSLEEWRREAARCGLGVPQSALCCYPRNKGFIEAGAALLREALSDLPKGVTPRVLFSAHGLPKKIISGGDPYQWQVEQGAQALVAALAVPGLDWQVCYQSRVGPLVWIGPSTEDEIRRAGKDKRAVVLFPIAFVSEHSETLVELDIEYRDLAEASGVERYIRVPTVSLALAFIAGLASLVEGVLVEDTHGCALAPEGGLRICPKKFSRCPVPSHEEAA